MNCSIIPLLIYPNPTNATKNNRPHINLSFHPECMIRDNSWIEKFSEYDFWRLARFSFNKVLLLSFTVASTRKHIFYLHSITICATWYSSLRYFQGLSLIQIIKVVVYRNISTLCKFHYLGVKCQLVIYFTNFLMYFIYYSIVLFCLQWRMGHQNFIILAESLSMEIFSMACFCQY